MLANVGLRSIWVGTSMILASACTTTPPSASPAPAVSQPATVPEPQTPPSPPASIGTWGFDQDGQDLSVAAGDDFDAYANGKWKKSSSIPSDLSRYGVFIQLRLDAEEHVHSIVKSLAEVDHASGSLEQKVGDTFRSWMDTSALETLGIAPLSKELDRIKKIRKRRPIIEAFASLHHAAPYDIGIIPNPADTTQYMVAVSQSGLGLPSRDYYLNKSDRFEEYRTAYLRYIERLFTLAGISYGKARAASILNFETKIAKLHWTPEDSRNIKKIYNPMKPEKLASIAPGFNWPAVFETLGLPELKTILVVQPSAISGTAKLIRKTKLSTLRNYLSFHYIHENTSNLPAAFDEANFELYGKTLRGIEKQRDRWKRGISIINRSLGEAVGRIYIKQFFPPEAKQQMDELVDNLITAFRDRLQHNTWMDEETRAQALSKLATFEPRIGYPSKWIDYTPLTVGNNLFANMQSIREFQWKEDVKRLAGPVDRQLWPYPPQTVNASYNPLLNQITFPAGILQPPFFDPNADPAVNYGAIGAVIGHEIGHGFDDQGRRFDEKGRIRDWWTQTANEAFTKQTARLAAQFSSYEPIEGQPINGELTMGENIGDLGGMQMAYAAYHRHLDNCCDGKATMVDGLSGDQRFFLSWAQVWRSLAREDALREQLLTDPHSPPRYRINGVVRNVDAWYQAFNVTSDHELYLPPEERVRIW